jgi:hypothetical protein
VSVTSLMPDARADANVGGDVKYPDNETAFRVLAEIAMLEVVETEAFPAEDVAFFMKALV